MVAFRKRLDCSCRDGKLITKCIKIALNPLILCSLSSISVCCDGSGKKVRSKSTRTTRLEKERYETYRCYEGKYGHLRTFGHQLSLPSVRLLMFCNIVVHYPGNKKILKSDDFREQNTKKKDISDDETDIKIDVFHFH